MDQEFARQQIMQIVCGLFCLVMMALRYDSRQPLLANVGLIIMLLSLAVMLAGSIILRFRLRVSHPEWPEEKYLAEQRKKITARIALVRRNMIWFFAPSLLGFLLWQAVPAHSIKMVIVIVILAVLVLIGGIWRCRWMLRKDLLPILEEIDQELADLERKPVSRED
jgi:uncharacterized membrane protein YqjE